METQKIGEWAFLIFVVIAIIAGLVHVYSPFDTTGITAVLVILGIIVGLLNVTEKETTSFLIAAVALLLAGTANFSAIPGIGQYIAQILHFVGIFVAPAAVIVALKAIYALGRGK